MGKVVRPQTKRESMVVKIPAIGGPGDPGYLAVYGFTDSHEIPAEMPCAGGVYRLHPADGRYVWCST